MSKAKNDHIVFAPNDTRPTNIFGLCTIINAFILLVGRCYKQFPHTLQTFTKIMSYAFKRSSSQRVDFHSFYEVKTLIYTTYILQGGSENMFIYNNGDHIYMTYMYVHVTYTSSTLNVFCMHKLLKLVDF